MAVSRWMFTKEQILNTPSRKHGIDSDKELSYRQQAANLIQDMGQRLSVTQLCINTAIVYMHRFYMFQSFGRFPRNDMAPACLFLAAKVEEQPRKLEHVIRVAHACLHRDNTPAPDPNTEAYLEQAQVIVVNENILLQTLGFETSVDHPHTHVVKTTSLVREKIRLDVSSESSAARQRIHMKNQALFSLKDKSKKLKCRLLQFLFGTLRVKWNILWVALLIDISQKTVNIFKSLYFLDIEKASKDLAQTSYFLATNSLHLTTFCLQYRPSLVACVCIYLASKWSNWKIAKSNEGKEWYYYVDRTATQELLEELQAEFLSILDKGPNKLKKKIMGWKAGHREQLYQSEEEKAAALESRKLKAEPSATSSDPSRSYVSSSQHRHTNHDRKHAHSEKREQGERKEDPDRREIPAQFHLERKEIGPTGDGHPIIKKESHAERRDIPERREEKKDYHDKRNTEIKGSFERKDSEKKDLADKKLLERKDTADRKEVDGKSVVHIKREGEKKDLLDRKDSDRQRAQYHGRTDIHTLERKNTPDKNLISDKIDHNVNTDLMSRTSLPVRQIKTENQPETQTSAKPEFVVPKSESKPQVKEIQSASLATSNDSPNVVPVSVSNPSVDSLKSAMHRSKSETTLNYKEYLQRKEREKQMLREKQQQLLEKLGKPNLNLEKQSSDKHSLNRTFTEGSQSGAYKHKLVNLDTSLPIKIQGALPNVKEETGEIEIENEVNKTTGIGIKAEQENTRKRTDTEVKIHNGKEAKPRKRSNSKSPGASKRSPRINASNNIKISPIKVEPDPNTRGHGSHLKSIKAENPHLKLQITSNSSGNTLVTPPSPALKSPVKNLKEIPKSEPFVDLGEPLRLDDNEEGVSENGPDTLIKTDSLKTGSLEHVRPELSNISSPNLNVTVPKITVKQEPQIQETKEPIQSEKVVETQDIKQEPNDGAGEPVIQLKPEHSGIQPFKLNIKELTDTARDIAGTKSESPIPSLKISIKKEPGSGSNTPVKYKSEHSGNNTPLKFTIKQEPSSSGSPYEPLKMKFKASGSGYHTSEKHHRHDRPEGSREHSGKHRHKGHKSHKHKDRDRERKSSKHSHGAEVPGANGKHELKIRVKLGHSGMNTSSTEPGSNTVSKHDKHKIKEGANVLPEIVVLNKATNSEDHERHQPWSVSELSSKKSVAKELAQSPSRKRRRTPTVDEGSEIMIQQPQQKAVKTNSHRLRRSSSSHSVVSMEMSDSECGEDGTQNKGSNEDQLKTLKIKLEQAIQFQQKVIDNTLKQQQSFGYSQSGQKPVHPGYERQKSGFDLDYYCGNSTAPPLPQGHPPLPPTPPLSQADNTPPPPPPPPPQ